MSGHFVGCNISALFQCSLAATAHPHLTVASSHPIHEDVQVIDFLDGMSFEIFAAVAFPKP